jgi:FkbM family methyltransferase
MFPLYNIIYPVFKKRQDKREISILREYVKQDDVVLDIGANIGFYTQILSRLVGNGGKVYAFEPDLLNFKRLQKNCGSLPNVALNHKAVSDSTGNIKLYKSALLNVDHRTYPGDFYESVEEIACICGDEFFPDATRIDFIKIDIQGYETAAFRGMRKILSQNPQVRILSEFWPHGLQQAGENAESFLRLFWNAGFQVFLVTDDDFESITPENWQHHNHQGFSAYMNIFVTRNLH